MKKNTNRLYFLLIFIIFTFATIADISKYFFPTFIFLKLMSYIRFPTLLFLIFSHGIITLGKKDSLIFFFIAFLFSLTSELLGSSYGLIFGKYTYAYQPLMILNLVPFLTPFYWIIVIYTAFSLTNLFVEFRKEKILKSIFFIFILSTLDGFIVMNIDMISEPISISQGRWMWEEKGSYFFIPISNFFGWWIVTFLVTFIFRLYRRECNIKKNMNFISIIPIGVYFMIFIRLFFLAFIINHLEYALIGVASMLPVILISFIMIYRSNSN